MKNLVKLLAYVLLMAATLARAESGERKVVYREDPEYPAIALQMKLHGTVKLRIWIAGDGTVHRLEYIGGHPLLAQAALKAVKEWKYEASSRETTALVEIKF